MEQKYHIVVFDRKRLPTANENDGEFDFQAIQDTLNSAAAEGWGIVSYTPVTAFYGKTVQFVAVLKKESIT